MKKLTLDKTWELSLEMWKWIAGEVRKAKRQHKRKPKVGFLKAKWLKQHYAEEWISADCFFCEVNDQHARGINNGCFCPARKIDKEFECMDTKHDYSKHPIAFYKKLVQLNKIRLTKKSK